MIDITPLPEMLAEGGLHHRGFSFSGVLDPLKVRVIALSSGEEQLLLIAFDLGGAPDPEEYLTTISNRTGIPEENILFIGTHAHATPLIGMKKMTGIEDGEEAKRYGSFVFEKVCAAIDEAIETMQPARYGYAQGESYINTNRNQEFITYTEEGDKIISSRLGFNPAGPCDKTLYVIRFEDYNGKPIAFFINYPLHNVALHNNTCFNGKTGISGDVSEITCGYLEKKMMGQ